MATQTQEAAYSSSTASTERRPGAKTCPAGGWGYFDFNHFEPKAPTAKVKAKEECAFCHIASAKKDEVWTQFYRLLDK